MKRLLAILWESVGKKLILLPITAAGLVYWLNLFGLGDDPLPVRWAVFPTIIGLWLIVGLINQNVLLHNQIDLDPKPDQSLKEAFQYLMLESKWSIGKSPEDESFYPDIESEIRDKARLGQLRVWARPKKTMTGGATQTLAQLEPDCWDTHKVNIPTCIYDSEPSTIIIDYTKSEWALFDDAQVSRAQVESLWPRASYWVQKRDQTSNKRQEFFEQERKGPVNPDPVPLAELEEIINSSNQED